MDVLGIFLGLLGTLIGITLPMTGWAIRPRVARLTTIMSVILTVVCLAPLIWKVRTEFQAPLAAAQAMLELPSVRFFFLQASMLLVTLIAVTLLLIRPLFRSMQEMKRALVRYVLPRHLSKEQSATIAQTLSQHPPGKIVIQQTSNFEEANAYGADFHRALTDGGWEVSFEAGDRVMEGLSMHLELLRRNIQQLSPDKTSIHTSPPLPVAKVKSFGVRAVMMTGSRTGRQPNRLLTI